MNACYGPLGFCLEKGPYFVLVDSDLVFDDLDSARSSKKRTFVGSVFTCHLTCPIKVEFLLVHLIE